MTIDEYLNSLPETVTVIDVSNKKLVRCPSLVRFKHLVTFNCQFNKLEELPEMSDTVEVLMCHGNRLTRLDKLPRNLIQLYVDYNRLTHISMFPPDIKDLSVYRNQLTCLPPLPPTLQVLNCSDNRMASLPLLPQTITEISCDNNRLKTLPPLPPRLVYLSCEDNPIQYLPYLPRSILMLEMRHTRLGDETRITPIMDHSGCDIRVIVDTLYRFRVLYYTLKLKQRFRDWLWLRVRLPRIEKVNHPDLLQKALTTAEDNGGNWMDVVEEWGGGACN